MAMEQPDAMAARAQADFLRRYRTSSAELQANDGESEVFYKNCIQTERLTIEL